MGVAKTCHGVNWAMLSLYTKLEPNLLSYLKDTACFLKRGGARGPVGVAKFHPKFRYILVCLYTKFQLIGSSSY